MLGKHPVHCPSRTIGKGPGSVPNAREDRVGGSAAGSPDGEHHFTAGILRHDLIPITMECPDGYINELGSGAWIASAAYRDHGGEPVRVAGGQIPAAIAAHGEACQIDSRGVDVLLREDLSDCDDGGLHRCRLIDRVWSARAEWGPRVVKRALRCQDEAVSRIEMRGIQKSCWQIGQLPLIVIASFASAMKEDHKGCA